MSLAKITSYQIVNNNIVFALDGLEKNSRPGQLRKEIQCPGGTASSPLSLTACLTEYSARTAHKRSHFDKTSEKTEDGRLARLFKANTKPYQPVQPSTLAKWLLVAMIRAGMNTTRFKARSTRSASATQMKQSGMSLTQILVRAHWSETSGTFAKFYDRS